MTEIVIVVAIRVNDGIEEHRHGNGYWHPTSRIHRDVRHSLLQRMPAVKSLVRVLKPSTTFIPILNWDRTQKGIVEELSEINFDLGQQETSIYRDVLTIYPNGNTSFWSGDICGDIHQENDDSIGDLRIWM